MACVLSATYFDDINKFPENILLEIFKWLSIKDICVISRVCRKWRRVANDNQLWRHVDLMPYKLSVQKVWKIIRAHFSEALRSLALSGSMTPDVKSRSKHCLTNAMMLDLRQRCPKLQSLHLAHMDLNAVSSASLPSSLTSLALTSSLMNQGWWSAVMESEGLPNLISLDLDESSKTGDGDLKAVSHLPLLTCLRVNGCYRTQQRWVIDADEAPALVELQIGKTHCSDLALHSIGLRFRYLQKLNLAHCHLLTPSGVCSLAACLKNLEWLSLAALSNVDDDCLMVLKGMNKLQHLDVSGTKVTAKGLQKLKENIPLLKSVCNVQEADN